MLHGVAGKGIGSGFNRVGNGGAVLLSTCLDILENATFYVEMATGGTTIDTRTGNRIPNKRFIEVSAYLKCNQQPPRELSASQPNGKSMLWVVGWIVRVVDPANPLIPFPASLPDRVGEVIKAKVGGIDGRFYPMHRIQSSAIDNLGLRDITGEALWGWWDADA